MEDKKKMVGLIAVIVLALAAVVFTVQRGPGAEKLESVGTLEEGINKDTGLPLNPPPAQEGAAAQADPSL